VFFAQRISNIWNKLPEDVLSTSVNQFKSRLNEHWNNLYIKLKLDCYTHSQEPEIRQTS